MMTRLALSTALAIVAGTLSPSAFAAVQNGDKCGVTSRDFLNYDYRSDYLVAGEIGCTLGGANANANVNANANEEEEAKEKENNGDDTGCFCAPNLSDGQSLSEWEWQCNGTVRFGPSVGKTCPPTVPVAKGLGILEVVPDRKTRRSLQNSNAGMIASVGAESMQQKMGVPCDTTIHPTGRPGDEVCPYSDCDEEGGNHSAICACVDLSKYGMGEGSEWVCMHSTCSCGEDDGIEQDEDESESESESTEEATEEASEDEASEEDESSEDLSSAATLAVSALASVSMVAMAGLLF